MGLLNEKFVRLFHEARSESESAAPKPDSQEAKMASFRAAYAGNVYGADIPYRVAAQDGGGEVTHYLRLEYTGGDTTFAWFSGIDYARQEISQLEANRHPNIKAVIGPHRVPRGKRDVFQ